MCLIVSLVMPQGTGTMEETLGQYLCHMRTQKGVSLEDIAKATRIDPRYLQAVEQNDFSQLPRAGIFHAESTEAICEVARKNTQKVFPEPWLTRLCSSFKTLF